MSEPNWSELAFKRLAGRGIHVDFYTGTPRNPVKHVGEVVYVRGIDSHDGSILEPHMVDAEDLDELCLDYLLTVQSFNGERAWDVSTKDARVLQRDYEEAE